MKKRGQFYLLAAMIIIIFISGFAAVSNYTRSQGSVKIYDLKNELGIESGKVLEYGVFSDSDTVTIGGRPVNIIEHFINLYETYAGENKEIYFIYGNKDRVTLITYDEVVTGSLRIVGSENTPISQNIFGKSATKKTFAPKGGVVKITIEGIEYEFEIKPGENFFFVISQAVEGEQHVAIS
jgi:hypothetical protein